MLWGASKPWSCDGGSFAKAYPGLRLAEADRSDRGSFAKVAPPCQTLPSLGTVMGAAVQRRTLAPQKGCKKNFLPGFETDG